MVTILILIFILVAGYLTTHFLLDRLKHRFLLAGGLEYMLLGVMAGPPAARLYAAVMAWLRGVEQVQPVVLISDDVVQSLAPAITLGIGSIGLLAGLRVSFRRRNDAFDFEELRASLLINLITAVIVGGLGLGALLWFAGDLSFLQERAAPAAGWPWTSVLEPGGFSLKRLMAAVEPLMPMVLLLMATAMVSAATPIAQTVARYRASGQMSRFVVNVAELSEVIAILVFGLVFCIAHPNESAFGRSLTTVEWLVIQVVVGVVVGLLFSLFLGNEDADTKLLLAIVGIICFATGVAYYLKLSPIFINFFAGLTLANTSRYHERLLAELERVEKPFYIVLYFFAGVAWVPWPSWWALLLIPLYIGARSASKWLGGRAAAATATTPQNASGNPGRDHNKLLHVRGIGVALMAQGGLSVAMVLNYIQVYGPQAPLGAVLHARVMGEDGVLLRGVLDPKHDTSAMVATVILVSVLLNEFTAVRATRNVLINAGEIDARAQLPPEEMYTPAPEVVTPSASEPPSQS